ncbi:helix-turn-helix domain-containing protein [Helicobacter pylori]
MPKFREMRANDDFTKFWHSNKTVKRKTGLSQEKFALSIDMDRTYYASVENGKRNISLKNIKKIADGFGVSLETLFQNLK